MDWQAVSPTPWHYSGLAVPETILKGNRQHHSTRRPPSHPVIDNIVYTTPTVPCGQDTFFFPPGTPTTCWGHREWLIQSANNISFLRPKSVVTADKSRFELEMLCLRHLFLLLQQLYISTYWKKKGGELSGIVTQFLLCSDYCLTVFLGSQCVYQPLSLFPFACHPFPIKPRLIALKAPCMPIQRVLLARDPGSGSMLRPEHLSSHRSAKKVTEICSSRQ